MNISKKHIVLLSAAFLFLAIPALAQIEDGVSFKAPFAFRVGDATMPAGSYRVSQPDDNVAVLMIQAADGSRSTIVAYRPVDKDTAPSETLIQFKKYGNVDFLNRVSIAGDSTELQLSQSEAEKAAAQTAAAEEHALPATSGGTQPAALTVSQPTNGSN
jgi:hypothetical protein